MVHAQELEGGQLITAKIFPNIIEAIAEIHACLVLVECNCNLGQNTILCSEEEEEYHLLVCSYVECYYIYYNLYQTFCYGSREEKQTNEQDALLLSSSLLFRKVDI